MFKFVEKLGSLLNRATPPRNPNVDVSAAIEFDPALGNEYTAEVGQSFSAYQQTIEQVAWVNMAVSIKADNASRVPLIVRHKETHEEYPDHMLMSLLKCPNPHDTGGTFRALTMQYAELTGNVYYEKVRDRNGLLRNLHLLNSARVEPIPDPVVKIKGYRVYTISGERRTLPPDKVVHFKYPNPNNSLLGLGKLAAARMAITLDLLTEQYNKAFFDNNATPAALLIPEEPLGVPVLNRVRNLLKREFQGVHRQHGIGILGANMRLEKIGINPKDIEFLAQQGFSRDKIGSIFHVPPVYMGNFSEASYANSDAQRKLFWEVSIIPWIEWFLEYVNLYITPVVDPEVEVIYDKEAIIPLIESLESLTKSLGNLRNAGFITTNEGRRWLGLPNLDDERHDEIWTPTSLVPPDQEEDPNEEPPPNPFMEPAQEPEDPTAPTDSTEEALNGLSLPQQNRVRHLLTHKNGKA